METNNLIAYLEKLNPWWESDYPAGHSVRDGDLQRLRELFFSKGLVIIEGILGSGKQELIHTFIGHLINHKHFSAANIIFFDHIALRGIGTRIDKLLELHRRKLFLAANEPVFIFAGDLAGFSDRELASIVNYIEQHSQLRLVFISSRMLPNWGSKIRIHPLSFAEYLEKYALEVTSQSLHLVDKYFSDYLTQGGLFIEPQQIRKNVEQIIYQLAIPLSGARNENIVWDIWLMIIDHNSSLTSINKIAKQMKVTPDSARRYLNVLANSFLINLVPKKEAANDNIAKKIFVADSGILNTYKAASEQELFLTFAQAELYRRRIVPRYLSRDQDIFVVNDNKQIFVGLNAQRSQYDATWSGIKDIEKYFADAI